jgi:predicted nucleic acid-binding protein
MVIIDTSVWIEFFRSNDPCFDHVSELLDRNEILALSPVFGELLQGAKNNRERSIIQEFWENLPKISEESLFIKAGLESSKNKWIDKGIGLIDSVIITASRHTGSFVWTFDKKLLAILKKEEKYAP